MGKLVQETNEPPTKGGSSWEGDTMTVNPAKKQEAEKLCLRESLNLICTELKAPKSRKNEFGHYEYRNVEDINAALRPICAKYSCGYYLSDHIEAVLDRIYVVAEATFYSTINLDDEKITVRAYAREQATAKGKDEAQITGGASSYARKYALCGLFRIDNGLDPDDPREKSETPSKPAVSKPAAGRKRALAAQEDINKLAEFAAELADLKKVEVKKVLDSAMQTKQLRDLGVKKGQKEFFADQCTAAIGIIGHWIDQVKEGGQ